MTHLIDFVTNKCLIAGVSAWILAQILKAVIHLIVNKKFDIHRLFGDGGMPSGHSATVASVATMSALLFGFGSFQFAISAILALIVGHDAMGVRLEAGKQAMVLNELIELMNAPLSTDVKLKEFLGHTPIQVFVGGFVGITNALLLYFLEIGRAHV